MEAASAANVGGNLWKSRVYAGLSVASELAAGLDRSELDSVTLFSAWKVYFRLGTLNKELEEILSEYDRAGRFPPEIPAGMIQAGRDILLKLYSDCKGLHSVPNGFPIRGLINARLERLQAQSERILDVADWFEVMSNADVANAKFEAAIEDLTNGDVVPWSTVR